MRKHIWIICQKLLCLALCTALLGAFPAYAADESTGNSEAASWMPGNDI